MPLFRYYRPLRKRWLALRKPELLANGGFELFTGTADDGTTDNFDDWYETGTGDGDLIEASTTCSHGLYAAKVTYGNNGAYLTQDVTAREGWLCRLSFWTRGDDTRQGRYAVYDVTNTAYIITSTNTGVTGTTYSQIETTFAVPSGCSTVRLFLFTPTAAGSAYYDQVSLRKIA